MARDVRSTDGVERDADGHITAFRIWPFGIVKTDHGEAIFDHLAAMRLIEEQSRRGNLYSIDVDHMSLSNDATPINRRAVGWHSLTIGPDGLWLEIEALDPEIRASIDAEVPGFKYFSPAYRVDEHGRISSYINTALTNNPATWHVTTLANRTGGNQMDMKALAAMLTELAAQEGDVGEAAKLLLSMLPQEPAADPKVAELEAKIASLLAEKEQQASTIEEVEKEAVLASRQDLGASVLAWLKGERLATVKAAVAAIPVAVAAPVAAPVDATVVKGTRGGKPARDDSPALAAIDRAMGLGDKAPAVTKNDTKMSVGLRIGGRK